MGFIALVVAFCLGIDIASDLKGVEEWAQVQPVTFFKAIVFTLSVIVMIVAVFIRGEDI